MKNTFPLLFGASLLLVFTSVEMYTLYKARVMLFKRDVQGQLLAMLWGPLFFGLHSVEFIIF